MKKLWIAFAVVTCAIAALFATTVHAGVQDFYFSDFSADYYLSKDADGVSRMQVVESLTAEFPDFNQNKGIERMIPRTNQGGKNLVFDNPSVAITRNGQPEPIYETERNSENYFVSTGTDDYVRGTQKYGFRYEFTRVVTEFDGYQELYWDTNGTGWKQRFDALTARVHLGKFREAFTGDIRCFVGAYGSKNETDCEYSLSEDDGVITFRSLRALAAGENLTFAVKFKPGAFVIPEPETSYGVFMALVASVLLILIIFCVSIAVYRRKVSVPKKRNQAFIVPEYLPPKNISLYGAARIYSKAGNSGMAAQLIDLAVKGKIRIIEAEGGLVFKKKKYSIEVLNTDGLLEDEADLLRALTDLNVGATADLSKLSSSKSMGLFELSKKIYKRLTGAGFMAKKESRLFIVLLFVLGFMILGGVFAVVIVADGSIGTVVFMPTPAMAAIPAPAVIWMVGAIPFVSMFIMLVQWQKYANLTDEGYKMRNYLRGLEEYIKLAEADRIKFLQGVDTAERMAVDDKTTMVKLYEKLLPYAIIFGQEKQWSKALELYYNETGAPGWYGGSTFNAAIFASSMSGFSNSMQSTYGSGTGGSSSSSSGFGGGGSSGGGGGGGGGGGR